MASALQKTTGTRFALLPPSSRTRDGGMPDLMTFKSNLRWFQRSSIAIAASCLLLIISGARAQTVTLDQGWQLLVDRSGNLKVDEIGNSPGWRSAHAGLSWNAQFADLRDYM